jgi:hypothetical protein
LALVSLVHFTLYSLNLYFRYPSLQRKITQKSLLKVKKVGKSYEKRSETLALPKFLKSVDYQNTKVQPHYNRKRRLTFLTQFHTFPITRNRLVKIHLNVTFLLILRSRKCYNLQKTITAYRKFIVEAQNYLT